MTLQRLDDMDGTTTNPNPVQQWTCNGSITMVWGWPTWAIPAALHHALTSQHRPGRADDPGSVSGRSRQGQVPRRGEPQDRARTVLGVTHQHALSLGTQASLDAVSAAVRPG